MAKILIIDDRPINRQFLTTLLGYQKHELREASDGAQGLRLAREWRPDLIISDVLMPTMDGYEFVLRLRREPHIAKTPVVFSTAHYLSRESQMLAAKCGVSSIILKPCEPQAVLDIVEGALYGSLGTEAESEPESEEIEREHLRLLTDKVAEKNDQLREAHAKISALVELSTELARERDPAKLLDRYCAVAREVIGSRWTLVVLLGRDRKTIEHLGVVGIELKDSPQLRSQLLETGAFRTLMNRGETICLSDVTSTPAALRLPDGLPRAISLLVMPLTMRGQIDGWICLGDKLGLDAFTEQDQQLAEALAAKMAVAYDNARLYSDSLRHARLLEEQIAERKRAAAALSATVTEMEALFASMTDVIVVLDDQGRHLKIAPTKTPHLYKPAEERIGKTVHEVFPKETADFILAHIQRVLDTGSTQRTEYELPIEGDERWYDASISPMTENSVIWVARDITERKKADKELRKLSAIVENSTDLIGIAAEDGSVMFLNRAGQAIVGLNSDEEVRSTYIIDYVAEEDRDRALNEILPVISREGHWEGEIRFRNFKTGVAIPMLQHAFFLKPDKTDGDRLLATICRDITERKQAEERLEEQATLLHLVHTAIMVRDPNNMITFWSRGAERLYGWSAEEALGKVTHEFLQTRFPRSLVEINAQLIERGYWEGELIHTCKDGTEITVDSRWASRRDPDANVITILEVNNDITERKQAEDKLRESESRYRSLFDNMLNSFAFCRIIFDGDKPVDLVYLAVNRAFETITGLTDVVGKRVSEVIPGIMQTDFELFEHYGRVARTGVPERFEIWIEALQNWYSISVYSTLEDHIGIIFDVITERKQAEQDLRASEERYRDLVENARDIIYSHDLNGNYTASNRAGEEITGYTQEESLRLNFQQTIAPEFLSKAREMLTRKLAGEKVTAYELEIVTKDGRRIPVEVNTRLVIEKGVPVGITGIARDITERKRAEAELRFQKSLLESQTEASIDGVLVVSPDRQILSFNQRFLDLWGIEHDALANASDLEILPNAARQLVRPEEFVSRVNCLYEHPDEESHDEMELKDGRTFERYSAPVIGPQGEHYGRVWFFRDITERKLAQAELTQLAAAVEQTAESIVITDTQGRIEYVNPAFENNTGYTKDEVLGQNPRILKSGHTDASVYRDLWQTITGGKVWAGQLQNRRKDGTLFTERATISVIHDESGKIAHYLAVKQDITREIGLEDQLRQSQKMEAIGQLAGGVAHDFNNLLTAINGYSSLALQRIEENHPLKGFLEEIKKAGDRAANLTRQLLAFGRKQILMPVPLDLNDVVSDMNKMLRRLIGEDIELISKVEPALPKIKADPGQIEQVLVNLVVNARDAMPTGGTLTIETAGVELDQEYAGKRVGVRAGKYAMLAVSDTGTGMNEETRARIYDPFFTTKERGKGTGLGLSTVYGIVKQSGGNIWVYSEPNCGTTFKVYLPQIESAEPAAEKPIIDVSIPSGSETILLVEDEDVVRRLAREILEQAGYKIIEAARGEEAIRLGTETANSIDLLLTDVVMPQMSGKEVANSLAGACPEMKVLFMSGYTDEAIVQHGVLDPDVEFIQKPFTPLALAKRVRSVLDQAPIGEDQVTGDDSALT